MSRRTFLSAAAVTPALAAAQTGGPPASGGPAPPGPTSTPHRPVSIAVLESRYRRELFEELLPFWDRHGIDHERGGFMCALDYDGTPVNTHKFLWFQGRGIWVYSHLYNAFGRDSRWLDIARRAADFALEHVRQPDGSWARLVTREGAVLEAGDGSDTSGLLYMAEGLQELAAASGDDGARTLARELVIRAFREGTRSESPARRQGLWFVTVLVCTQMLKRWPDEELEEIARRSVDAIILHHHNPETRLNDEVIGRDLSRLPQEAGFTIFGHSIEALWMVLDEAVRRRDLPLIDCCAERMHRHLEVGWDRLFGGLIHAVHVNRGAFEWPPERPVGTAIELRFVGEYHYMKTFWSLAEVLVATLKVLEQRRAAWAVEYFERAQNDLDALFSLEPLGHPLYVLFTDRKVEAPPHATRQENYHHPRALMIALEILQRMRASGRSVL